MPVEIRAPDGTIARFPDGTPDEVITRVMRENFGGPTEQPQAPKTNRTSALEAGLEGVAQGLTFGFADEIEAGGKAVFRKLAGDESDLSALYDESVESARSRGAAAAEEHPLAYYGGEIGSSLVVPGALGRLGIRGAAHVGGSLARRATAGAAEGAAYGGAYGAGKSEGDLEDRAAGALGGAAVGGAFGAAAPVVVDGIAAAARPISNLIRSVTAPDDEAARRIAENMDADELVRQARTLTPAERVRTQTQIDLMQQGRIGGHRNIDVGGENIKALARSAANVSPDARDILNRSNTEMFEGQSTRAVDFLRGLVASPGNAPQTRDALRAAARAARGPLYDAAYAAGEGGISTPALQRLAQAPAVEGAMRAAARNIGNKAGAGRVGRLQGPNGPTLQFWDQVSRELRDQHTTFARQGANEAAADIQALRRQLLDELDAAVPEFRQARGTAAQYFGAEDAIEAGEVFARGTGSIHDAQQAMAGMGQAEQEAFREGFISQLVDRASREGDRRSLVGKLAGSPDARQRLETALGPNRARELEAFMHTEFIKDLARQAMGNSTTARQLTELGLAGGAGMLASGGNITDPSFAMTALLMWGAQRGGRRLNTHVQQNMARRIAEMLVSNDATVFRRGLQQMAHGPLLQAARSVVSRIAPVEGLVGGTVAAQEATDRLNAAEGGAMRLSGSGAQGAEAPGDMESVRGVMELLRNKESRPGGRESTNIEDRRPGRDWLSQLLRLMETEGVRD
jgi:hypothetical protein